MKKLLFFISTGAVAITGCKTRDKTPGASVTIPELTTTAPVKANDATYTCGGNVTAQRGATVTECGVAASISPNPTTDDNPTNDVVIPIGY